MRRVAEGAGGVNEGSAAERARVRGVIPSEAPPSVRRGGARNLAPRRSLLGRDIESPDPSVACGDLGMTTRLAFDLPLHLDPPTRSRYHAAVMLKRLLAAAAVAIGLWSWFDYRAETAASGGGAGRRKIAVVLSVGGLGDKSFNDSAYEGLLRAGRELDIVEAHGEPADIAEPSEFLDIYAEEGYDLIIGVGYLMQDAVEKAAARHPQCKFALIDAPIDPVAHPNCASLLFSEHEGSFLVGALAAMASMTGKIGFVGGMDVPLIHKFEVGYAEGARHVNPACKVLVKYTGAGPDAFHDPVKGKAIAESMIAQGADVLYHASGSTGNGVIQAAAERGKLAIGVDANQNYMKPGHVLTSMLKRVDVAVFETIRRVCQDRFEGKVYVFGLKDEGVGYALDDHNRALVTPEMERRVEEMKAKIVSGEIRVTDYMETGRGK